MKVFLSDNAINHIKSNYLTKSNRQLARDLNLTRSIVERAKDELNLINPTELKLKEQLKLRKNNQKKCRRCNQIYPMTQEFFSICRSYHGKRNAYLSNICKSCNSKKSQKKYLERFSSIESYSKEILKGSTIKRKTVTITENDIINQFNKQNGLCYYTGEPLKFEPNSLYTISIDRLNPLIGYEKDNIVLCLNVVNLMKQDFDNHQFVEWCEKIVKHHKA